MIMDILFYALAAVMLVMTGFVLFSRSIVHSVFALLGVTMGVAGIFGMLGFDYLAVAQIMIYVGGIMVLFLFAIMFTSRISDIQATNRAMRRIPAGVLCVAVLGLLLLTIWTYPFSTRVLPEHYSTAPLGTALLGHYLSVVEVSAVLIVVTLVGAVSFGRARKGGQ